MRKNLACAPMLAGLVMLAPHASGQNIVRVAPAGEAAAPKKSPEIDRAAAEEPAPAEKPSTRSRDTSPAPGGVTGPTAATAPAAATAHAGEGEAAAPLGTDLPQVEPDSEAAPPSSTSSEWSEGSHSQGTRLRLRNGSEGNQSAAEREETEEEWDPGSRPLTHHQRNLSAQLGLRASWVPSASFDAFSSRDVLFSPVVRLGFAPWSTGRFSLALTPEWSFASSGALSRGAETGLGIHRLGLGLEGRFHSHHRYYAYVRVSPGVALVRASLTEPQGARLASENWSFRVDSALGLAARLAGDADGSRRGVRFLAYVEGGFDWTASSRLLVEGQGESPPRVAPLDLGSLDLSGPHVGGGLMLTW